MTKKERRKHLLRRRALPILMAVVMILTMGFLPSGNASASIPTINYAKLPPAYASGYHAYKCIDISNWQGALTKSQFKKLKSKGISDVIVRVGYTRWASFLRFKDASYKENITNAYAAGLKVGAYYYSQAKTEKQAVKEANKTIKLLKKYKSKITLPVAFDYEFEGRLSSRRSSKLKSANAKICAAFCDKVKKAGYTPMVYAATGQLENYLNTPWLEKKYKIWAANFMRNTSHTTGYDGKMYMWQFSDSGRFGTSVTDTDRVDLNYIFVKKTGEWVKMSNGKYKYREDGVYLTSQWLELDGKKYYLNSSGYRVTGYKKIGNYYYGFDSNGVMYKDTKAVINGKTYKFLKNGRSILYRVKVVNVSDGLAYRTGPSTSSKYKTVGKYDPGYRFNVVRTSGDWFLACSGEGKGCWSLSQEDGTTYLEIKTAYPLEQ